MSMASAYNMVAARSSICGTGAPPSTCGNARWMVEPQALLGAAYKRVGCVGMSRACAPNSSPGAAPAAALNRTPPILVRNDSICPSQPPLIASNIGPMTTQTSARRILTTSSLPNSGMARKARMPIKTAMVANGARPGRIVSASVWYTDVNTMLMSQARRCSSW